MTFWKYLKFLGFLALFYYVLSLPEAHKFEIVKGSKIKEGLGEVRGIDEIKGEVEEIVAMIKHRRKYLAKGAKVPRGVMLFGEPGTGKTMLARAIAKEAGVVFIYQSGASFDTEYVGSGAKNVRKLFEVARRKARFKNVIIFIDEVDSLFSVSRREMETTSSRATIN